MSISKEVKSLYLGMERRREGKQRLELAVLSLLLQAVELLLSVIGLQCTQKSLLYFFLSGS